MFISRQIDDFILFRCRTANIVHIKLVVFASYNFRCLYVEDELMPKSHRSFFVCLLYNHALIRPSHPYAEQLVSSADHQQSFAVYLLPVD